MIELEKKNKILQLYKEGMSISEIANKVKVERHTVGAIIKENSKVTKTETGTGVGFAEFDEMNRLRQKIIEVIPAIAKSAERDSIIRVAMMQQKIYVLSIEEINGLKELKKVKEDTSMRKKSELIPLFSKILKYIVKNYGIDGIYIESDEVYAMFTNFLDFVECFFKKGYIRHDLHQLFQFYSRVAEIGLEIPDLGKLNEVIKISGQKKLDLIKLIGDRDPNTIFEVLDHFTELYDRRESLLNEISSLELEKDVLSKIIGIQGSIAMLKSALAELEKSNEKLKKENKDLLKQNVELNNYPDLKSVNLELEKNNAGLDRKNEKLKIENENLMQKNKNIKEYQDLIEELPRLKTECEELTNKNASLTNEAELKKEVINSLDRIIAATNKNAYFSMMMLDFFANNTKNDTAKEVSKLLREQYLTTAKKFTNIKNIVQNNITKIEQSVTLPETSSVIAPKLVVSKNTYQSVLNTSNSPKIASTIGPNKVFTLHIIPLNDSEK